MDELLVYPAERFFHGPHHLFYGARATVQLRLRTLLRAAHHLLGKPHQVRRIGVERLTRQGSERLLQPLVLLFACVQTRLHRRPGGAFGGASFPLGAQFRLPRLERKPQGIGLGAGAGEQDGEDGGGGKPDEERDHAIPSLGARLPEGSDMHRSSPWISLGKRSPQKPRSAACTSRSESPKSA